MYDADGTRYEHLTNTDAADRPFFCMACWPELKAHRNAAENKHLDAFAGGTDQ